MLICHFLCINCIVVDVVVWRSMHGAFGVSLGL